MLVEKLLTMPGFIYEVSGNYYYLGKWICKMCTDTDASDCVMMYQMCRRAGEEPDTIFSENTCIQRFRIGSPLQSHPDPRRHGSTGRSSL